MTITTIRRRLLDFLLSRDPQQIQWAREAAPRLSAWGSGATGKLPPGLTLSLKRAGPRIYVLARQGECLCRAAPERTRRSLFRILAGLPCRSTRLGSRGCVAPGMQLSPWDLLSADLGRPRFEGLPKSAIGRSARRLAAPLCVPCSELQALPAGCAVDARKLSRLRGDLDAVLAEARTLGAAFSVVPVIDAGERRSPRRLEKSLSDARRIAPAVRTVGLQLAYHNHDFEFVRFRTARSPSI